MYLQMQYGPNCRGEFWTAPTTEKTNMHLGDARCRGEYGSKYVTPSEL